MSAILGIIQWLLEIIAGWPARKAQAAKDRLDQAKKDWSDLRIQNEKDKEDRARSAALISSAIVRPPTKGELQ